MSIGENNQASTNDENCMDATSKQLQERLVKIHALLNEVTSSPSSHDIVELALATATSLDISQHDDSPLVWLMIVGVPGSDKTQRVLALKQCSHTTFLDSLTPNCFASGHLEQRTGRRAESLLPKLDGQCLVIKDLTTLFSMRADDVKKILGDLQSIYDGSYTKATGTVGVLDFDSQFTIIACITPLALKTHQTYMSRIGGRFLLYGISELTDQEKEAAFDLIWTGSGHKEIAAELNQLIVEHVDDVLTCPLGLAKESPLQQSYISMLAEFMAAGRSVFDYGSIQKPSSKIVEVQTEHPWRSTQQLRTLGRALARVHGRDCVTDHDLEVLRRIALSSINMSWKDILRLIPQHPEGLTVNIVTLRLGWSITWARKKIKELGKVGILESSEVESETLYYPIPKYQRLLAQPWTSLNHAEDLESWKRNNKYHNKV